jgi:hypothetical protein
MIQLIVGPVGETRWIFHNHYYEAYEVFDRTWDRLSSTGAEQKNGPLPDWRRTAQYFNGGEVCNVQAVNHN